MAKVTLHIDAAKCRQYAVSVGGPVQRDITTRALKVHALAVATAPIDKGQLKQAHFWEVVRRGNGWVGRIVAAKEYAAAVHEGRKAVVIRPRNRKVLRWPSSGGVVFSRYARQPARAGKPWLRNALKVIAYRST